LTKKEYEKCIFQRAIVGIKNTTIIGEVTKFNEDGFSVLWQNETHSGNYDYKELKQNEDGSLFVEEKRSNKLKE
jgi:hypothetical protein